MSSGDVELVSLQVHELPHTLQPCYPSGATLRFASKGRKSTFTLKAVCWGSIVAREVIAKHESITKRDKAIQVHVVRIGGGRK